MGKILDKPVYGYKLIYTDQLDLIKKALEIFAIVNNQSVNNTKLRPKLLDVLVFYILLGYTKTSKKMILESLGINKQNLNQINSELTKKGYLVRDLRNFKNKHLSEELKMLQSYFISDDITKFFLIKLSKNR